MHSYKNCEGYLIEKVHHQADILGIKLGTLVKCFLSVLFFLPINPFLAFLFMGISILTSRYFCIQERDYLPVEYREFFVKKLSKIYFINTQLSLDHLTVGQEVYRGS